MIVVMWFLRALSSSVAVKVSLTHGGSCSSLRNDVKRGYHSSIFLSGLASSSIPHEVVASDSRVDAFCEANDLVCWAEGEHIRLRFNVLPFHCEDDGQHARGSLDHAEALTFVFWGEDSKL